MIYNCKQKVLICFKQYDAFFNSRWASLVNLPSPGVQPRPGWLSSRFVNISLACVNCLLFYTLCIWQDISSVVFVLCLCFTEGGELPPTEPSLVQQHKPACYGGSLPFEPLPPCGLPALSKAQEGNLTDSDFIYYFRPCKKVSSYLPPYLPQSVFHFSKSITQILLPPQLVF